jgi:hypothetical protein
MSFVAPLAIGAILLAGWLDWRFDERRPVSVMRRAIHAAAAYAVLQAATAGAHYLIGENAGDARRLSVLFLLFLPSLVYAFLTGLWLMRTLAEVASTAHH